VEPWLSQESVHDVKTDEPTVRMSECFWDGRENPEAERLPQADRMLVRFDDSVELYRRVPILRRDYEYAVGQGRSDAPAGCGRRDHEACIGDMTASSWLIRMKLGGSHDCSIVDGDEYPAAGLAIHHVRAASSLVSGGQQ
jgi:hypothetical protein